MNKTHPDEFPGDLGAPSKLLGRLKRLEEKLDGCYGKDYEKAKNKSMGEVLEQADGRENAKSQWSDYLDASTIHGVRYLNGDGKDTRWLWLLAVVASLALAGVLGSSNIDLYLNQPYVISDVEYQTVEVIVCTRM